MQLGMVETLWGCLKIFKVRLCITSGGSMHKFFTRSVTSWIYSASPFFYAYSTLWHSSVPICFYWRFRSCKEEICVKTHVDPWVVMFHSDSSSEPLSHNWPPPHVLSIRVPLFKLRGFFVSGTGTSTLSKNSLLRPHPLSSWYWVTRRLPLNSLLNRFKFRTYLSINGPDICKSTLISSGRHGLIFGCGCYSH